jgi:hypothetical protein
MQPCGQDCPRAEGQGAMKKVCFAHRILVFHFFLLLFFIFSFFLCFFFFFLFFLMVLHDVTFDVTATI